jgi:NAD(P)-dependent dehydrogenase (short-subunit alcohol dehydrogenase family)
MRVLVTGAAGFIGAALSARLLARGDEVCGFDNLNDYYDVRLKEQQAKLEQIAGSKKEIGFGSQIRSYVLQPYQMVKDLRTGISTSDTQGVLDGDLDKFMAASLAARIKTGADVLNP